MYRRNGDGIGATAAPPRGRATARSPAASASVLAVCAWICSSACSIASMTGDMMSDYTVEHLTPYLLANRDLGMACETGASMGSYLLSFERVTSPPHRAAISTMLSAAQCAEELAWQEELRGLRAINQGLAPEAQDARIAEKRARVVAADRYHRAFRSMVAAYGEPSNECPRLEEDDELLWLLGLLGGVLSVQHDRATGGLVGVPMDVLRKASRGAECLPDARWWGAPRALQATVWLSVPGSLPEGKEAWPQLEAAAEQGVRVGVRLAGAMFVQAAINVGDEARLRAGIARFAAPSEPTADTAPYQLLDAIAQRQVLAASDRLWTEATGHRTPPGSLGQLYDPASPAEEDDTTDLLDDLGETPQ